MRGQSQREPSDSIVYTLLSGTQIPTKYLLYWYLDPFESVGFGAVWGLGFGA